MTNGIPSRCRPLFVGLLVAWIAGGAAGLAQEAAESGQPRFTVTQLSDTLYALGEPDYYQANYSYLVVGEDAALMFDSGASQTGEVLEVIRSITDKPVTLLPSHLHFDHVGSLNAFPSVALVDLPFTRAFRGADGLYHVPDEVHLGRFDDLTLKPFAVDRLVAPGAIIDLGGVSLEVVSTPGHTPDEIALFDAASNTLLTGDHLYPSWLLVGNLDDYIASVAQTLDLVDADTRIYAGHAGGDPSSVPAMTRADVAAVAETLAKIKSGTVEGDSFSDPDLIRSATVYEVSGDLTILTDIVFQDGQAYSY